MVESAPATALPQGRVRGGQGGVQIVHGHAVVPFQSCSPTAGQGQMSELKPGTKSCAWRRSKQGGTHPPIGSGWLCVQEVYTVGASWHGLQSRIQNAWLLSNAWAEHATARRRRRRELCPGRAVHAGTCGLAKITKSG